MKKLLMVLALTLTAGFGFASHSQAGVVIGVASDPGYYGYALAPITVIPMAITATVIPITATTVPAIIPGSTVTGTAAYYGHGYGHGYYHGGGHYHH